MLVLIGLLSVSVLYVAAQVAPSWWQQRGALDPTQTADDYAAANQGQVKNLALAAYQEMEQHLAIGAGPELTAMVQGWQNTAEADDFAVVTVGQVKAVALLFYQRLSRAKRGKTLPWGGGIGGVSPTEEDYGVANLGQVKHAFSFAVKVDLDGNGIDDSQDALALGLDSDGDGVSDADEIAQGTDPYDSNSNLGTLLGLQVYTPVEPPSA
ncbi:MAG: hypothetical protein KDK99_19920 [Verrucomicrobiales bacterium]|nr:hypothetical protein [Verrucomicrobiales bacterium]